MSDGPHNEFEAMGASTDAHEKLRPFAGTFRAEVRMWMGPGDPMASTGTMVNEFELGGRFLRQTYTGDPNDGPFPSFEGRGYWGYNTITKQYEGFWIDNASTMMQTDTGQLDQDARVWSMVGEMTSPQTGESMVKRTVITLEDDDHHLLEMYFDAGDDASKAMEIRYARVT